MFAGQPYDSVSMAGGMARKSIVGSPSGRDYPQTNGWTFWQYRRTDGARHPLDDLRRQLHERKVIPLREGRRTGWHRPSWSAHTMSASCGDRSL